MLSSRLPIRLGVAPFRFACAALHPTIVVAGHKKVDRDNDPKTIADLRQNLRDFSEMVAEEDPATAIVTASSSATPHLATVRTLWHSARSVISRKAT